MYWCTLDGLNSLSRNQKSSPLQIHQRSMGQVNEYAYIIGHNYILLWQFRLLWVETDLLVCFVSARQHQGQKGTWYLGVYKHAGFPVLSYISIQVIFYLLLPCANLPLHNNFPKHEQHRIAGDSAQQSSNNFPKNTSTPQHRTGLVVSTHLRKNQVKLDDFPKVRGKNKKSSNHLRSHPTWPNLRADSEWPYGLL